MAIAEKDTHIKSFRSATPACRRASLHRWHIGGGICRPMVVLVASILLTSFSASAQTDPAKAMELFREAKVAFEAGDNKTSVRKLREAVTLVDDAPTQAKLKITIARRLLDLNEPTEALKELQSINLKKLRRARSLKRLVQEDIQKVEELLKSPVRVVFETFPPGASIRVNADSPKKTPLTRKLRRGDIKVEIGMPGYKTVRARISVKGSQTMRRRWVLEKKAARVSVRLLNTANWEGAPTPLITVDNEPVVLGEVQELQAGDHTIQCTYPKHPQPTKLTVTLEAGTETTVNCALPEALDRPGSWKQPVGWASVGTGAAALAAGIGLLASWGAETSEYPSPQYTVNSSKPLAGGIVTGLGAGLVGFGTYLLLSD